MKCLLTKLNSKVDNTALPFFNGITIHVKKASSATFGTNGMYLIGDAELTIKTTDGQQAIASTDLSESNSYLEDVNSLNFVSSITVPIGTTARIVFANKDVDVVIMSKQYLNTLRNFPYSESVKKNYSLDISQFSYSRNLKDLRLYYMDINGYIKVLKNEINAFEISNCACTDNINIEILPASVSRISFIGTNSVTGNVAVFLAKLSSETLSTLNIDLQGSSCTGSIEEIIDILISKKVNLLNIGCTKFFTYNSVNLSDNVYTIKTEDNYLTFKLIQNREVVATYTVSTKSWS